MKLKKLFLSAAAVILASALNAQEGSYFYAGGPVWDGGTNLYVIDTSDFSVVETKTLSVDVGSINGLYGLALSDGGQMYALYQSSSATNRRIGTLDTVSALITDIGDAGNLTDIAFVGGTLYGTTGSQGPSHELVSIDVIDGSTTSLFDHSFGSYGPSVGYHSATDQFFKMSSSSDVTLIDVEAETETAVSVVDHPGEVHIIVEKNDSMLYVINYDNVFEYNVNTGVFTELFFLPFNVHAMTAGQKPFSVLILGSATFCSNEPSTLTTTEEDGGAYQWVLDGTAIDGATEMTYVPTESGFYSCIVDGEETNPVEITIIQAPVASFTADPSLVVLETNPSGVVDFTNTSDGGDTYFWDFDNDFATTTENPTMAFTSVGTYDVQLLVTDSETQCSDSTVTTITVIEVVGLEEEELSFSVYPNPASDELNISLVGFQPENGEITVEFISIDGKTVKQMALTNEKTSFLDVSDLNSGKYILVLKQGTTSYQKTFVKQ